MPEKEKVKPACLKGCYYYGYAGLRRACFHPENPRLLTGAPPLCPRFEPEDRKVIAGEPKPWADRLTIAEFWAHPNVALAK
jgi:hypothetical protein